MNPYYSFKDPDKPSNCHTADIDIHDDSFKFSGDDFSCHYEFFIFIDQGDIGNFGGQMELDFVE